MSTIDLPLTSEPIRLNDGFEMDVFSAAGAGVPKATIVLLSPIFGVDPIFTATVRGWAEAGYRALAPDYFGRVFPGAIPHTDEGFREAIRRVKAVDRRQMMADLGEICTRKAAGRPLFVGGYCAGGEPALRMALDGIGDGWVIFHAARLGIYSERLGAISRPLDIHFGGEDTLVPPEEVDLVRAGSAGNANISITVHPGAVHGFTQRGSRNYHEQAAKASFSEACAVLDRAIG